MIPAKRMRWGVYTYMQIEQIVKKYLMEKYDNLAFMLSSICNTLLPHLPRCLPLSFFPVHFVGYLTYIQMMRHG